MDEDSFSRFYRETARGLQGYIRRTCQDPALAEDILQDSYCRMLRTELPDMDPPRLKAYLYRTASSLLADHWRRLARERLYRTLSHPREAHSDTRPEGVGEAFDGLKPADRALLWLAYVEGFDHREIAQALRLRRGSVRVLLYRSRKRLLRALRPAAAGASS